MALPLLGGALLRIAAGWGCDWYGARRTGLLVLGLQLIAVSWAVFGGTSYGELLGIGLLLGAGGASFAVAMPVASRAYPAAHQGLVLGLVASGNVGTVLILFLAPRWESSLGWHGACAVMLLPLLLALGLFSSVVRDETPVRVPCPRCLVACRHGDDARSLRLLALFDLWHYIWRVCRADEFSSAPPA